MDHSKPDMDFDCDRRSFLKYTGFGLAAVSFAGASGLITNANAATNINMRSEEVETAVLVIGSGLAGTSAAVGAKKKGWHCKCTLNIPPGKG